MTADRPARPLTVRVGPFAPDVPAERKAVIDAVLRAGCRPLDAIEDADVYVGVFGAQTPDEESAWGRATIARLLLL